ncbi:chromosome partitioning protein ParA [Mucilaginibacter daejeonensis]|uniref:7TMR-DISM family protein n=1 Tax=Mucilaginibacter daejeonensis TaxID=398049 RepID=UPI001D175C51|nr:7TM diverse intracellular signaling domain-containing protein [Mucilaginibacter daejeonensis]UEG51631.1 chromosome partitioning protein ParA [Mucilaginibacter daejeonensis]
MIRVFTCLFVYFITSLGSVSAQVPVTIDQGTDQHIFMRTEVEVLKEDGHELTLAEVQQIDRAHGFTLNHEYYPQNLPKINYWYKVKIHVTQDIAENASLIEFFDQTVNDITAYLPLANGGYSKYRAGADMPFDTRLYKHKNLEFKLERLAKGDHILYFRVRSQDGANMLIVYRRLDYFVRYATTEYLTYGLFYGIILIFSFHNLLMFMAVRKRQYLYYILYILSVGLYEMTTDGIAFQYIWPNAPHWNQYAFGVALFSLSIFALEFTKALLHVKRRARRLYKIINTVIVLRTLFFLYCLFFNKSLFYLKVVEFVPLIIAFAAGVRIWYTGFKPARFFVLGYTFLTIGFVIKGITVLGYARVIPGLISNYSLGFSFILEMLFLSFAIGDQVRIMRKDKETAQDETIRQMEINNELKDSINKELEVKVAERTKEVIEKSEEIFKQAHTIEEQNKELLDINTQLEQQAAEITRMNVLLENDNIQLKTNIEKVTDARAMSTELSFEEFSAKYPDQETCNKFLADIKWSKSFNCIKCGNEYYKHGRAPYSRRCTKCNYEESVLYNTIFQNNRIPINKAFYIVYLIYTTKGAISSYQLSEKLQIRQSTCWHYALRIKKVLEDHKSRGKKNTNQGWSKLILEIPPAKTKANVAPVIEK